MQAVVEAYWLGTQSKLERDWELVTVWDVQILKDYH